MRQRGLTEDAGQPHGCCNRVTVKHKEVIPYYCVSIIPEKKCIGFTVIRLQKALRLALAGQTLRLIGLRGAR